MIPAIAREMVFYRYWRHDSGSKSEDDSSGDSDDDSSSDSDE